MSLLTFEIVDDLLAEITSFLQQVSCFIPIDGSNMILVPHSGKLMSSEISYHLFYFLLTPVLFL